MVGFGTRTAAELQKTYAVTLGGVGDDRRREDDAPRSGAEIGRGEEAVQQNSALDSRRTKALLIQEKMISGKEGKDYKLFQFSNLKIRTTAEPALPDAEFELKLPAGVNETGQK